MHRYFLQLTLIIAVCLCTFFINLGACQLWDRDEPRNAGCASEMMQRGDIVVPFFNDELRHQKPVMLYWLMIASYAVLGVSEFSARFPSALLATGSVLATFGIARRLFGTSVASLSAVVLASSVMFDVAARAATPDSTLIFFNTLSIWIYVTSVFAPFEGSSILKETGRVFPKQWWVVAGLYSVMGLGVLTKGPIGAVIPTAVIGLFCMTSSTAHVHERFWRAFHPMHFFKTTWLMRPLLAIFVIALVAGPWYVLVHLRTAGDFTNLFFFAENFGRATTSMENHRGGLWFYPVAILVGFFPWSVFWWPVVLNLKNQWNSGWSLGTRLMVIWVVIQVGLFSLAQTKLPSYVTPCYGALAILTASCLHDWRLQKETAVSSVWLSVAVGGLAIGGIAIVVAAAYFGRTYFPDERWLVGIGLVPIAGALLLLYWNHHQQRTRFVVGFAAVAVATCTAMFGFGTARVGYYQNKSPTS